MRDGSNLIWLIFGSVLPAFVVAMVFGYVVRANAARWGLVAVPGGHSTHKSPTPLGGGLAIWLGVLLPLSVGQLVLWLLTGEHATQRLDGWLGTGSLRHFIEPHLPGLQKQSVKLWILMAGGMVLVLLGLWDDRAGWTGDTES